MTLLYGAKGGSSTTSDLYTIDPATGAASSVGPIGYAITGLAFDPTTGILYGVTSKNSLASPKCIITINPLTGAGTLIGALGLGVDDSSDICFDSTGQMYGWSTDTTTFMKIDKATGAGTLVGGAEHSGNVSCNSGDVLYKVGFGAGENIDTVNKVTGARTVVSVLGAGPGAGGPSACAFDSADLLYALWNIHPAVHLVTINPATGVVTDIGATGSLMDGLAWEVDVAPIVQRGVCLAFDAASGDDTPVWTSLYDIDGLRVQEWDIDRGRAYELDKTQAGTVTCRVFDYKGVLDATNAFSPYAGKINPLMQIAVFLTNPVTGDEDFLFRGKVENIETVMDVSMKFMIHTITGVDGFDDLANAEVIPDGTTGNATYAGGAVDTRIGAALTDGQWSGGRRIVFSGNVDVQKTVYAPRDQILSVVLDGADAEFPGVANCYIDKRGNFVFHGRLARFNPTDPSYADFINSWKAGDGTHADADATIVPITSMEFDRSKAHVYNTVLSTPQNIAAADIAGQISTDAPSVTAYGVRTLSFENLVTADGEHDGLNAKQETKLFSDYYVNNYKTPRTRVNKLGFRIPRDNSPNLAAWWAFVCGFDISDVVLLTTTHIGGGGFNENLFVEGVHIHAVPLKDEYPELDVDIDLSPAAYYSDASGLV